DADLVVRPNAVVSGALDVAGGQVRAGRIGNAEQHVANLVHQEQVHFRCVAVGVGLENGPDVRRRVRVEMEVRVEQIDGGPAGVDQVGAEEVLRQIDGGIDGVDVGDVGAVVLV